MSVSEYNFDGLTGPTHNFSGLAYGNIASQHNRLAVSKPKAAALQGLEKMRYLHNLGINQGIIPPQDRPNFALLRQRGYEGCESDIFEKMSQDNCELLYQSLSASAMWTANAATISPSMDTKDHFVHITPANLISQKHRTIELPGTVSILKKIFNDQKIFRHHAALEPQPDLCDEGAANHMRLCFDAGRPGLEIFVYGKNGGVKPKKFPARQTQLASKAHIRNHCLNDNAVFCIQQNPEVIDQGVFHNDVIAVSNDNVLLVHEQAYCRQAQFLAELKQKFAEVVGRDLHIIEIKEKQLSVKKAVKSYLFNSQIVTLKDGSMILVAPSECKENPSIFKIIQKILSGDHPLNQVHFVDLTESMKNGGGPACLRLRVVLSDEERAGVHKSFLMDEAIFTKLEEWINNHFRDTLHIDDLHDYQLVKESRQALDRLTQILDCGSIYEFQK